MEVHIRAFAAVAAFGLLSSVPAGAAAAPALSIVPQPRSMHATSGAFVWATGARVAVGAGVERNVAAQLSAYLARNGFLTIWTTPGKPADIVLERLPRRSAQLGDEGYELRVGRHGVTIRANTARGLFYGLQTLDQVSGRSRGHLSSRFVSVVDRPEYRWRGIHLDVARHFFSVAVVKRYIDVAAHYKLNVFHWHLTDDQAWRLQSTRYPALTAGREAYSPSDVREIVAYAARRYVTVVPEIEMPAHASAALRAYPQFACGSTLCQTGSGLEFARNVLADVMAQFPSPYLHAGGDEVAWPASLSQSSFTRAIERYAESYGRRFIAWDDVYSASLSRRATVMVWTGRQRAASIARHGNDVVITSPPLYFDAAQGDPAQEPPATRHMSTLEEVYSDSVMPAGLRAHDSAHVLGAQANVWTEHIATAGHLFWMTLPRELALAEIAWTPRSRKSWSSFLARLPAQFTWLEAHGYPFRIPNVSFAFSGGPAVFEAVPGHVQSVDVLTTASQLTVTLRVPVAQAVIRYTTDGRAPSATSHVYRGPFTVRPGRARVSLRAAAFLLGRSGAVTESRIAQRLTPAGFHRHAHASRSWASLVSP
jgi:hexosaminidase